MDFNLTIACDGDAFDDATGAEVARILTIMASRVKNVGVQEGDSWTLLDSNGNTVGLATFVAS